METIICSRCGKEIPKDEHIIKLTQSDPFNGADECYWCQFCYDMFMDDLEG